jgi:hypothetical protein
MSSLGDIQQIHSMLQQISRLLDEVDTKADAVKPRLESVTAEAALVNQALQKSLTLFQRMGLPENVEFAITVIQRLIMIANQLRLTIVALNAMMAGTPGGALLFGISAAMVAMDVGDLMMMG